MAKNSDEVTLIEKFRGNAWVGHCIKITGRNLTGLSNLPWMEHGFTLQAGLNKDQLKELEKAVNASSSKDNWSKYKGGNVKPYPEFVDGLLSGTKKTWNSPLWTILDANQEEYFKNGLQISMEILDAELDSQLSRATWWLLSKKPVGSMTIEEKAQALLEISINWTKRGFVAEDLLPEELENSTVVDLRFANRDDYFLTLAELVEKEPNALASTYAETFKRFKKYKNSKYAKFRFGMNEFKILESKRLIAFIALIVLIGNTKNVKLHAFLKAGIKEAVADVFGKDVAEYVSSPICI